MNDSIISQSLDRPFGFAGRICLASLASVFLFAPIASSQNAAERKQIEAGKELFQKEWKHTSAGSPPQKFEESNQQYLARLEVLPGDGLGPMFNATSCEACHKSGGGAGVDRNVTLMALNPKSPNLMLLRGARAFAKPEFAKPVVEQLNGLFPAFISSNGAISLDIVVPESSARPLYASVRSKLADYVTEGPKEEWLDRNKRTSKTIAENPIIEGQYGDLQFAMSQRNSPPLFGLGLIDRVPNALLESIATRQNRRSGGKITGRLGSGKFGWRAQTPSLAAFVAGACAGELGLQIGRSTATSSANQLPDLGDDSYRSFGQDLSDREFVQLVSYVRALPRPVQERTLAEEWVGVRKGRMIFGKIGCNVCHVEDLQSLTGVYSDLLLHDMGELLGAPSPLSSTGPIRLARVPPEYRPFGPGNSIASYYGGSVSAGGNAPADAEWRTPPLWGLADSAPYLHDGRAETIDSAIRWHGGEGADSARKYRSLPDEDHEYLMSFLKSLRAPVKTKQSETFAENMWLEAPEKAKEIAVAAESNDPSDVFAQGY